ncbi:MAG: trypsin-like peptidase domain-containing protein, partial [Flavobacteriales bacterium]|nr:trypsin-like peptidase domain-containing protein [Flavobacteriales bacterium]
MSISDFEIEKYFEGDLTDAQRTAFEEKMQADALFSREVRAHRQLRIDLKAQGVRLSLLDQMEDTHIKEFGGIPYLKSDGNSKKSIAEKEPVADSKKTTSKEKEPKPVTKPETDPELFPHEKKASEAVKEVPKEIKASGKEKKESSPKAIPNAVRERKVVSLRMFYTGIGIAASLAAVLTLGGISLSHLTGKTAASSEDYSQLMEESSTPTTQDSNKNSRILPDQVYENGATSKFVATAFAIAKDGYFITNSHVVKGSKKLTLKLIDEKNNWTSYRAEVVMNDEFSDLAMVKIVDSNFKEMGIIPFTFSDNRAQIGEEIFTLGYAKQDIVMEPGILVLPVVWMET